MVQFIPSYKTGDLTISRKSKIILPPKSRRIFKERPPSFKPHGPRPRRFLGSSEYMTQEIKKRGLKIDIGKIKVKQPLLDDKGIPMKDQAGNVRTYEKIVDLKDIGGNLIEKFQKLVILNKEAKEEKVSLPPMKKELSSTTGAKEEEKIVEVVTNVVGILNQKDISDMDSKEKEVIKESIKNIPKSLIDNEEQQLITEGYGNDQGYFFLPKHALSNTLVTIKNKLGIIILKSIVDSGLDEAHPLIGIRGSPITLKHFKASFKPGMVLNMKGPTGAPTLFSS